MARPIGWVAQVSVCSVGGEGLVVLITTSIAYFLPKDILDNSNFLMYSYLRKGTNYTKGDRRIDSSLCKKKERFL